MTARIVLAFPIALVAGVIAAGCGDLYSDPADPNNTSGRPQPQPTAFFDASSATTPRDAIRGCSGTARVEGSSCASDEVGTVCEYGASPDMQCNTTLACTASASLGSAWLARPSELCPSYQCPKGDSASVAGTPCALPVEDGGAPTDADELVCPMSDGVCACTTGRDALHAHARRWVCVKPTLGCPVERPLAGQRCSSVGACDYGSCAFKRGLRMECATVASGQSAVWLTGAATCN